MNLLHLAPDIQEEILFLPRTARGRDPIKEWQLRPVAAELHWRRQRRMWKCLTFDQGVEIVPVGKDEASDWPQG